jgi:transcription elongation factor/antiterminator RfaH
MANWFLVYTKPKKESTVSDKLKGCGFEVFNPKLSERKHIRRKLQEVTTPLFPCYIFVKFDFPDNYRLIKYTKGVRKVIGTDNMPTPVNESIINSIKERMVDGILKYKPQKFTPGDRVAISGGPFEGLEAIFVREMHDMERVSVLLNAMNARVVVHSAELSKS